MKTVLLLEDDKEFAKKCIENLLANNYEVKYADNAEKAKVILLENEIDTVIVDLMLPPSYMIEGIDFYRYVRSVNKNIKAVFMTTKSFKTTEIVAEAMKLGASDFLDKESRLFMDKLIFTVKNPGSRMDNNNEIKKTLFIITTYAVLLIIVIIVLIGLSYFISLIGLPYFTSFLLITGVASGVILMIIASQLMYEKRIKEETWSNLLKDSIVNFPIKLFEKFRK